MPTPLSDCCSSERLQEFAWGQLPGETDIEEVAKHLAECGECRRRLAAVEPHPVAALVSARDTTSNRDDVSHGAPWAEEFKPPNALLHHPKWRVLRPLGRGGMGVVYLARHRDAKNLDGSGQLRALKVLPKSLAVREEYARRFEREIRVVMSLPEHPHLVRGYEIDIDSLESFLLLAMEYVPGKTLEQLAAEQPAGRIPAPVACGWILQALCGLDHARRHGVVAHRDFKPQNLILSDAGLVKVVDFGLAKIRLADVAPTHPTEGGLQGCGSPTYAAPEQFRDLAAADTRSDIYSAGCTLYRLLAGNPPFGDHNHFRTPLDLWEAHRRKIPLPVHKLCPEVPADCSRIVACALAKDPGDRPQTPVEFAAALYPFADAASQRRVLPWLQDSLPNFTGATPITRHFPWWWSGVGLLLAAVAWAGWFLNEVRDSSPTPMMATAAPPAFPAAPPAAIAPFGGRQSRAHQEAWAEHLRVPVEWENSIGMKFVLIPPGEFLRGGTESELEEAAADARFYSPPDWYLELIRSESPQHVVELTQPFYLGSHELTQANYERVMGPHEFYYGPAGGGQAAIQGFNPADLPADMVSWLDAIEFCIQLSRQENLKPHYFLNGAVVTALRGNGYRLPTEAEWEFAARAGTTTRFWTGDKDQDLLTSEWTSANGGGHPSPVGELAPNPFGLFDMLGNNGEWVFDAWQQDSYEQFRNRPVQDPAGPELTVTEKTWRGGGWGIGSFRARCSARAHHDRTVRNGVIGFRVALSVEGVRRLLVKTSP